MKILNLRFKNLNSLYGEWEINFTAPEYVSDGIFAMTGPTGAGKSTILDAICLALYGSTPRLGKITQSGNEILSRGTGECFAEVLFQSQAGLFRCHWSQHRARKKRSGDLQAPKHEIADGLKGGKVIEHQLRAVLAAVEKVTGMDFERFTRSILLAQGDFDSFLNAEVEKKSKILEQITGTGIYTSISQRVHEKQRSERENLRLLQAAISGIQVLEPEEESEARKELDKMQKAKKEQTNIVEELEKAIQWLIGIKELKNDLDSLLDAGKELEQELLAFAPERKKFKKATSAASFEGEHATLTAARKQLDSDRETFVKAKAKLPKSQDILDLMKKDFDKAEKDTVSARRELQLAIPLLQEVRELDTRLSDGKKALQVLEKDCKNSADLIEKEKKDETALKKEFDSFEKELISTKLYLESNSTDLWLVEGFSGIKERLFSLQVMKKEIKEKEGLKKKNDKAIQKANRQLDKFRINNTAFKELKQKSVYAVTKHKLDIESLLNGRLLREYRAEKDSLMREKALLDKIADLKDQRLQLEDGKACPLCGAEKHPYAEGNVPAQDEVDVKIAVITELIGNVENLESMLGELVKQEKEAQKNLSESEKKELESAAEVKTAEFVQSALVGELNNLNSSYTELEKTALKDIQCIGIGEIADDVYDLIQSLRKRLENWQRNEEEKVTITKKQVNCKGKLETLRAVIDTKIEALTGKRRELSQKRDGFEDLTEQRKKIFGQKNPELEEMRFNTVIANFVEVEKQATSVFIEIQEKTNSQQIMITSLKKRIGKQEPELQALNKTFIEGINLVGFSDEVQFKNACLETQARNQLQSVSKELDHRQTDLKARTEDRNNRLSSEVLKAVTDKKQEELEPRFLENSEKLKQLLEAITGIKTKLSNNDSARAKIAEKQSLIDSQKRECNRWDKLHGLIGSADGKKYRNFAQGITFEMMVLHANIQLQKMTDRYLLIRNKENPLELNVIDNWQAGETRSVKNLSGGESFIVSLSLALGLSKMASRKVRVDSLFLDEGFGTLDEESLETALDTLAGLHQGGKLIGIISHVAALKERIRTQVNVEKVSGGKSKISGPGCTFVS